MKELIFGVSGVRGVVGESLTEEVARGIGRTFGRYITENRKQKIENRRKILVGKDMRKSGEWIKEAFIEGIRDSSVSLRMTGKELRMKEGWEIVDMGVISTPALLYNIREVEAVGGVVITASHNPPEWNGIKFANEKGMFLNAQEMRRIYDIYRGQKNRSCSFEDRVEARSVGRVRKDNKGEERHIEGVIDVLNQERIRGCGFKVVVDSPWISEAESFLGRIGCKVGAGLKPAPTNQREKGFEPTPDNLVGLSKIVKEKGADIGFATDADGDRLGIVTEQGEALDTEYTLALVASWVLIRRQKTIEILNRVQNDTRKSVVVMNLSTSRMVEDVVKEKGGELVRTKVGEINVVEEMDRRGAVLGGEGNGGIIDPEVQYTRDALVGMGRILEYMAISREPISRLANGLPKYYMVKEKIGSSKLKIEKFDFLVKLLPDGKINREDGLRIDFREGWIHVRKSNTEPIVRVICETVDKSLTDRLVGSVLRELCEE